ncbi:MAG TPA: hypothetical protein VM056_01535, partial [Terriglobales bacterium]|nr:hypothetical protein [Terriglobales bacterium]
MERAFLVGVEIRSGRRTYLKNAKLARESARKKLSESEDEGVEDGATAKEAEDVSYSSFSAEESMAELKELATSAGAQVVGEF